MQIHEKNLCPSCAMEAKPDAIFCEHCGEDLRALTPENKFQLVPDGQKFGIALRGRILFRDMDLIDARSTLAIINDVGKNKRDM